jgi:hypothetical protein
MCWLTSIIPATQKADIGGSKCKASKNRATLSQKQAGMVAPLIPATQDMEVGGLQSEVGGAKTLDPL